MKKARAFAVFCLLCTVLLSGCGEKGGHIKYYAEPTEEFTPAVISGEADLTAAQARTVRRVIRRVKEWYDDNAVNRLSFYFDGEFTLSGSDTIYYFSCDQRVIYYDHYYGSISEKDVSSLQELQGQTD